MTVCLPAIKVYDYHVFMCNNKVGHLSSQNWTRQDEEEGGNLDRRARQEWWELENHGRIWTWLYPTTSLAEPCWAVLLFLAECSIVRQSVVVVDVMHNVPNRK